MPRLPKMLVADSEQAIDHNQTLSYIKSLRPMRSSNGQTSHTPFGVLRKPSLPASRRPEKFRYWRKVWNPDTTYSFQEMVIVESGVSAGTYISDIDNNNNDPATGVCWSQIARGDMSSQWI
ncbi:MAG: hypothetical protein WCH99_08920 [Verrucomicrobiota bacterium]